ncbi:MAG: alpha-1,2-fucosyltransferase [Saprospiraceae bacterium]|nr:alpha-1,2-fucosyltransferase [Saprospiraceae bacterium]
MPKIIARIIGGLGNQMFVYAAAKALAARTGAMLVLDTKSGFRRDVYRRKFSLHHFDIKYQEANAFERFEFAGGRGFRYFGRSICRILPNQFRFYRTEKSISPKKFEPNNLDTFVPGYTWIEGYWQSPQYFEEVRPELQKELHVISPLSGDTLALAEEIRKNNGVCVHLRMLRHIINGINHSAHQQFDKTHFLRSMDFIANRIDSPHFYFFSDNPNARESLINLPFSTTFVTHNQGDDLACQDFHLMMQCRHFILSNSTFSWWPAWLSQTPESIVISPPVNYWDNRDILPPSWLCSNKLESAAIHGV